MSQAYTEVAFALRLAFDANGTNQAYNEIFVEKIRQAAKAQTNHANSMSLLDSLFARVAKEAMGESTQTN